MEVVPSPFDFQQFPLAHSMVLAKLSTTPTLLPEQLASLITAVSLAARVSIRASALFVEAIMETARYSTSTGLGLTRRALIAAVGSARALHNVNSKLDWSGKGENGIASNDAFLQVLDKYTNLGIYLIHHTFTLTELFTMSSFYLTLSTIQNGFSAAEASVRLLDSLLGSNETSRALSSIITLVKSELSEDHRFTPEERNRITGGGTVGLTALTKALTAWVCLQMVTHRRSLRDMKLRVVYDCTIIKGTESGGGAFYGSRRRDAGDVNGKGKQREVDDNSRLEEGTLLTDVRSELEASRHGSYNSLHELAGVQTEESEAEISNHIVEELEILCGEDSEEEEELPEDVRLAILEIQEHQGIVRGAGVDLEGEEGEEFDENGRRRQDEYDIDIIEETTTRTTRITKRESKDFLSSSSPFNTLTPLHEDINTSSDDRMEEDDEWVEIGTITSGTATRRSRDTGVSSAAGVEDSEDVNMLDVEVRDIPVAFNGKRRGSLATVTRQDALEHPEENKQRLQIVLRTMTKKFIQRKTPNHFASQPSSVVPSRNTSPNRNNLNSTLTTSTFRKVLRSPASSPVLSENNVFDDLKKASVALERDQSDSKATGTKSKNVLRSWGKVLKKVPSAGDFGSSSGGSRLFSNSKSKSMNSSSTSLNTSRSGSKSPLTSKPSTPTTASTPAQRRSNISPLSPLTSTSTPPSSSSVIPTLRRTNSSKSLKTTFTETKASSAPVGEEEEPKSTNWPKQHLVQNLQLFMRYSSGAYGQAFLRILGIGRHDFNYPKAHTLHVDANNHSFAHHVGVDVDDILLSSYTDTGPGFSTAKMAPIVNYVAVDHSIKSIVLSCRGSLGLSDILVDLTCSYEMISVQHGDPKCSYFVHSGMWCSATTLQRGTVHDIIKSALQSNPDYGIVLCGHSLGGGVAALLAILWSCPVASFERHAAQYTASSGNTLVHPPLATHFVTSFASGLPPGRPITCYTFGVPCVASPDLARYCEGLVISTVHNYDIVPTLSLGVLRDLKTMAMGLYSEGGTAEEIVGRVIGLYQRKFIADRTRPHIHVPTPSNSSPGAPPTESGDDNKTSLGALPDEAKEVALSASEIDAGRGTNKALDPLYRDPSLMGPEVSEDVELNDWLWSLVKTMRAGNDNEKLYPPGQVFVIENYTVFVSSETIPEGQRKYSRKEGKRVLLRAVDNVESRFSEPVFGRTMMSDHSPVGYENNIDLLFEAVMT